MKIAVLGYSGAGKSALARELGKRCGCPVLHLDQVQFEAGWRERDRGEALALVERFMSQESWVIDGNYAAFLQGRRLEEADRIILLCLNRFSCLVRAVKRYLIYRGRTREDMAEDCPEKLDPEFLVWLLWKGRDKAFYSAVASRYPHKTVVLNDQRAINRFLEGLSC